jgi:hypothetical protein
MTLEDAIVDVATAPGMTPFAATAILREADPSARAYELLDRKIWLRIGSDWATVADWAELVS